MRLKDLILPEYISLSVEARDWRQAIEISCAPLLGKAISENYVKAIIKNFEELGPYMVIGPGIAMPHARPEEGVLQTAMSLTVLKTPVAFGHKANDPVRLLITLCALDSEMHLQAVAELMGVLENKQRVNALMSAQSVIDVLRVIEMNGGDV
ncbi:MAG: PTS sugar transporter subunit IIA [Firmicutes bacterium]|nr:PTS sugar transporter subunit IIA [Bacillota bacterium]